MEQVQRWAPGTGEVYRWDVKIFLTELLYPSLPPHPYPVLEIQKAFIK